MFDLLVLVACIALGIAFFGRREGGNLVIQFPTAEHQKGIHTRTYGFIVLAIMIGGLVFVQLGPQNRSLLGFVLLILGAATIIAVSNKKRQK